MIILSNNVIAKYNKWSEIEVLMYVDKSDEEWQIQKPESQLFIWHNYTIALPCAKHNFEHSRLKFGAVLKNIVIGSCI